MITLYTVLILLIHDRSIMKISRLFCVILVLNIGTEVHCGSVLFLIPPLRGGRVTAATNIAKHLYDTYGYTSSMLVNNKLMKTIQPEPYIDLIFSKSHEQFDLDMKLASMLSGICEIKLVAFATFRLLTKESFTFCESLLNDKGLRALLVSKSFDAVIVDSTMACLNFFAHTLSIPRIQYGVPLNFAKQRIPFSPSTSLAFVLLDYGPKFTFSERIVNTLVAGFLVGFKDPSDSLKYIVNKIPGVSPTTAEMLQATNDFILIDYDPILDFPIPTMPNSALVGGLSTRNPKPIDRSLKRFMDSGKDGVIVISFGSIPKFLPDSNIRHLINAFKQLPNINFVFRNGDSMTQDGNILMLPWLPQNDLLSHPQIKAFITHCGNNGQYEALYHAVPMIGVPLFAEQHHNARRMESKGFGISIDFCSMNAKTVVNAIKEILDEKYKSAILNASRTFHSHHMTPSERAAFWVDHVITHGSEHLQPPFLPFYQYYMLDVFVFLSFITFCILMCIMFVVYRCCIHYINRTKAKRD